MPIINLFLEGRPFSEIYARQLISKISREELEDKYLRLQEDNQVNNVYSYVFFVVHVHGSMAVFVAIVSGSWLVYPGTAV